ncbi:MAG: hypothetical protein OXI96_04630 [Acidimicrobiaceae bacterium]|nr:hypothetical protein [Acidimicrobiaceae bacterium]
MNIQSYPKPAEPRSSVAIQPSTLPSVVSSEPSGQQTAMTVRNLAPRAETSTSFKSRRSLFMLSVSVASSPAYRAEKTPGAPLRAATSNPVSSATAAAPANLLTARAFSSALPCKSGAFSSTSPIPSGRDRIIATSSSITAISAALSGLVLAHTNCSILPSLFMSLFVFALNSRSPGSSSKSK